MYTATKYIGGDYVPGEILPDGLPEEFLRRMLNAGAIREDAPGVEQTAAPAAPPGNDSEGEAEERTAAEAAPPCADDEEAEAEEVEPEAPEVDVTAALVEAEEKPKPARRRGGKAK